MFGKPLASSILNIDFKKGLIKAFVGVAKLILSNCNNENK